MLYIKKKGSVGYTIVGTPTIVDGIASGFSSSNYLQIAQTYNATNDKNVEIYVRAKTPTTITSSFNPIFGYDNVGYWGISSYSNALFTIRMGYSNGTSLNFGDMYISGGIQADTWYRFKIKGNNGIWRAEIYNDSGTLLNSSDKDWTSNTLNENYTINLKCTDNTGVYSGAIDLKQTYIKIEGQPWFGVCPVEVNKHQIKGPIGYTVVGSPTIEDGIVSDFTYDNYFKTADAISTTGISSFEFYARVKTPSAFANGWCRICSAGSFGNQGTTAGIWTNSSLTQSFFHLFGRDIYEQRLTADTWYRIKYVCSQTEYTTTVYTVYDDNGNVLKTITANNSALNLQGVINFCQRYQNYVVGAIDLNNTYIKVNGKMWFYQPANTKYIVKDGRLVWADSNLYLLNTKNGGGFAGNSVYFNSGFVPTNKTTYEVMFDRMDSTDGSNETNCGLFGVGAGVYNNTTYEAFRVIVKNNLDCNYFGTGIVGTVSGETLKNGKRKVIKSVLVSNYVVTLTQSGTTLDTLTFNTVSDQTCFGNLYLGCYNYGYSDGRNPIPFYPFLGKIYYAKFWENGVLIRHFVPVPAGLVIGNFTVPSNGMFDIVNQQFYANQGTGEFTIGRDE